jgi:hypothetical protein
MRLDVVRLLYGMRRKLGRRGEAALTRTLGAPRSWHLVPHLSPDRFLAEMSRRDVRHAVVRRAADAGGLELLVEDDQLSQLDDCITRWPVGEPIRIYSVGGRANYSFWTQEPSGVFQSIALLPPWLGAQLIARAVPGHDGARVLTPDDAFCLLAYRTAYLEPDSWDQGESVRDWQMAKDRQAELRRLAASAGRAWDGPFSPLELDLLLEREGWRPPHDLLERAASWMPWIQETLPTADARADPAGLSLFFIRERAAHAGLAAMLVESLQDSGFEPLLVATLDPAQSEQAATILRGGNWGSGPYLRSGGPPAVIVVTLDLLPLAPGVGHRAAHPALDNAKIVMAKTAARNLVNAALPDAERYNALHSTDTAAQAWRIVRQLLGSHEPALRDTVERMRREFATDGAIEDLTRHGRRAKVELIEFEGQRAIRKTFKSTALWFMEREIEVMQALGPVRPEMPRLLARSPNSITIEYVGPGEPLPRLRAGKPRPLPLAHVRQIADFIKASVAHGFDPLDLRAPGNMIFTEAGLKVIDFELWRRHDPDRPAHRCFGLCGVPPGDEGRPRGIRFISRTYQEAWFPYTLLSLNSFLYDPAWLQQVKRGANFTASYWRWRSRALARGAARHAVALIRRQTRQLGYSSSTYQPQSRPTRAILDPATDKTNRSDTRSIEVRSPSTI